MRVAKAITAKKNSYPSQLARARNTFDRAHVSGRRILKNAAIIGVGTGFLLSYFPGIIPSLTISTAFEFIKTGITKLRTDRATLVADLVSASLDVDAQRVVADLFSGSHRDLSLNTRGDNILARQYLAGLKETDSSKFQQVIGVLQQTRSGRKLALAFV